MAHLCAPGQSLLLEACRENDVKKTTRILEMASTNETWQDAFNEAIIIAAQRGRHKIIHLLIGAGADVDFRGGAQESTPLILASKGRFCYPTGCHTSMCDYEGFVETVPDTLTSMLLG